MNYSLFAVLLLAVGFTVRGNWWQTVASCALAAVFCVSFSALCCLITESTAGSGILSSLLALAFLFLSGGILPPVMLPRVLREMMHFSPVTQLRRLLAVPAGFESEAYLYLAVSAVVMAAASLLLFCRRMQKEVQRI